MSVTNLSMSVTNFVQRMLKTLNVSVITKQISTRWEYLITKLIWYIELVVAEVATPWRNHANNDSQHPPLRRVVATRLLRYLTALLLLFNLRSFMFRLVCEYVV